MPGRESTLQYTLIGIVACLLLILGGGALPAQESDKPILPLIPEPGAETLDNSIVRLSLEDAIAMAQAGSPLLEEQKALIRAGQASQRLARAARLPDLDGTARYSRFSNVPEYAITQPDGSRNVIFPNIPNRYYARLGMQMPLYTGGRIRWSESAAMLLTEATGGDMASVEADIRLAVTDAYYRILLAEEQVRVFARSLEAFDAHLEDVQNRMEFGLAARNDLLAVQVQVDRAELSRIEAERDRAVAAALLLRQLGLPQGSRLELTDWLPAGDGMPLDLPILVEQALEIRPERAALATRVEAAGAAVERERAERKPLLSATAGLDYARPNQLIVPPEEEFNDTWDVSLNLSYRFWDGGKRKARVERASEEAEAACRRLEELDRAISEQVTVAFRQLEATRAAVPVAGAGFDSAEENQRVSRERYREGLIPSSELLDAEVALLRAGLDHTTTMVLVELARARLARAVGW